MNARARDARGEEQSRINSALLRLHGLLQGPASEPDLLRRINQFCVEELECDFSSTYLWDPEREVFRLAANVGAREEVLSELPEVEFPRGSLALLDVAKAGEIIELEDAEMQTLVPVVLLRSLDVSSVLFAPIDGLVGMDGVAGGFAHGYRARTGPFTSLQRRLALGIAQVSAKALDNIRLIEGYRRASELKSSFLATLSHELRTPVHVILGSMECLRDEGLSREQAKLAETVDRQARILASMIDDLLDVSAIEANRIALAHEPFDLHRLVEQAIESRSAEAHAKGLRLDVSLGADVPRSVAGDARRLGQLLGNILGNAIKYTERGGIDVEVRRLAEDAAGFGLRFAVRDTGIGIAPDAQRRLFEAFSRVHLETHRHYSGTGLGLAICKRLAVLLGGEIGVESEAGRGSTFWFTVRLAKS